MEPIKINVNVQVGLTDELFSLLSNLLSSAKQTAAPKPMAEPEPAAVINPIPEAPTEPEPAPAKEGVQLQPEKEYTEVDVRAAMERTRKRIEGEDYKENTDGDRYKRYHRQLTAEFKNIAALLGSDKPSTIASSELRKNFCDQCDELELDESGNLTRKLPF